MFEAVKGIGHIEHFLATKSMELGDILFLHVGAQNGKYKSGLYAYGTIVKEPYILKNSPKEYCNNKNTVNVRIDYINYNEPIITHEEAKKYINQFRSVHIIKNGKNLLERMKSDYGIKNIMDEFTGKNKEAINKKDNSDGKIKERKYYELDANDSPQFRVKIDILNEAFGYSISGWVRAVYPLKNDTYICGSKPDEKYIIWAFNEGKNDSDYCNTFSTDKNEIYEDSEHEDYYLDSENIAATGEPRIVFSRKKGGYFVFNGIYMPYEIDNKHHVFKRIATKIKLVGNPVDHVEIINSDELSDKKIFEQMVLIEKAQLTGIEGSEREIITKARVNHGEYRNRVLNKYGGCCLCGMNDKNLLIASHIKPWKDSDSKEKTDVNNALLLCPHHDKLFDKGLITFDDNGEIIISDYVELNNRLLLNIQPVDKLRISISKETKEYLKWHRDNVFRKSE